MSKDPMKGHKSIPKIHNAPSRVKGASPVVNHSHAKLAGSAPRMKKGL